MYVRMYVCMWGTVMVKKREDQTRVVFVCMYVCRYDDYSFIVSWFYLSTCYVVMWYIFFRLPSFPIIIIIIIPTYLHTDCTSASSPSSLGLHPRVCMHACMYVGVCM